MSNHDNQISELLSLIEQLKNLNRNIITMKENRVKILNELKREHDFLIDEEDCNG